MRIALADARTVAVDVIGSPADPAVLFFHGTPDTSRARHPDDDLVTERGRCLVAADRPGLGGSDPDPTADPVSVAADHVAILDHLSVEQVDVVAWSAGAVFATAFAGSAPERVRSLTLLAPLVPYDAYDDPGVLDGADASRAMFADVAGSTPVDEVGRELAPWLVPYPLDLATACAVLEDSRRSVADIDGAGDALAEAMVGAVAQGLGGLEREIVAQATPLGVLLDAVLAPTTVHVGDHDAICPPAMGRWYAKRLSDASLRAHPLGHQLGIRLWPAVLDSLDRA